MLEEIGMKGSCFPVVSYTKCMTHNDFFEKKKFVARDRDERDERFSLFSSEL